MVWQFSQNCLLFYMSTINNPKKIEVSHEQLVQYVRELAIAKYPELKDEEFEVEFTREGGYTCEPWAMVLVPV